MRRDSRSDVVAALWLSVSTFVLFSSLGVAATFVAEVPEPSWPVWLVRGGVALAAWLTGWVVVAFHFSALRRQGAWVPSGQRLGAAVFAAVATAGAALLWLATMTVV